jgi:Notch-like protein
MLTSPACLLADVDECAVGTACGPNTVCSNSAGSYACACKPGFVLLGGNNLKTDGCAGEQSVGTLCMVAALLIPK